MSVYAYIKTWRVGVLLVGTLLFDKLHNLKISRISLMNVIKDKTITGSQ